RPAIVRLAARAPLDRRAEHERLRELVARDVLRGLLEQVVLRRRGALAELDDRDDLLSPSVARPAGDDDVPDVGMVLQGRFDLFGEDLLPAGVDRDRIASEDLD